MWISSYAVLFLSPLFHSCFTISFDFFLFLFHSSPHFLHCLPLFLSFPLFHFLMIHFLILFLFLFHYFSHSSFLTLSSSICLFLPLFLSFVCFFFIVPLLISFPFICYLSFLLCFPLLFFLIFFPLFISFLLYLSL